MHHFFTTESTVPPVIPLLWYGVMVLLIVMAVWASLRYYQNEQFRKIFRNLQIFQLPYQSLLHIHIFYLICLYIWYFAFQLPWSNSLPLYHCRLAMFAVLLLPDRWKSKQFFALMGVSGAIFALGYPVFDPYTFPHITSFSFLLGHYCLLVNSLIYLLRCYDSSLLKNREIVLYTFVLDLFLVGVNQVTGGNYGLMARPPIIKGDSLLVNYVVVSSILAAALLLFNVFFSRKPARERVIR